MSLLLPLAPPPDRERTTTSSSSNEALPAAAALRLLLLYSLRKAAISILECLTAKQSTDYRDVELDQILAA
jgi:hypothetical protein